MKVYMLAITPDPKWSPEILENQGLYLTKEKALSEGEAMLKKKAYLVEEYERYVECEKQFSPEEKIMTFREWLMWEDDLVYMAVTEWEVPKEE